MDEAKIYLRDKTKDMIDECNDLELLYLIYNLLSNNKERTL
jgi:hypothetical protein